MADTEVKIFVTTDADLTDAEELQSLLDEIQAKAEETKDSLSSVGGDIDTTGADELASSLEEDTNNANDLSDALGGIDSSGLQEANSNAQELASSLSESAGGASELESAMGALGGAAAAAGLMEMVDTAGNINDSWNRLGLTFGSVSDEMKAAIDSAATATGRSGGTIRNYFNQMGIAGVSNTNLLSQSFEALSGRAYQTGNSIEAMQNVMQKMVLSGNAGARQLTQLGISTEDLGRAMGVSAEEASKAFSALSQEDRLRVLTQAMGDGKQANEEYKNSWQGVKDQASAAFAGLMGAVGTPILQMLIPIMQTATSVVKALSSGFKALPGPLQTVIGAIGGGVAIFTAFAGAIGVAGQVIGGLKSGIEIIRGLSSVSKILGIVRTALTTINTALAISEWAALGPIILIVAAVVALIAILWYLYNTNENVRNTIDWLIQSLMSLPETIYNGIGAALQWLSDAWNNVVNLFQTYAPLIAELLFVMATGGVGAIVLLIANFMGMPNQVGGALQNVLGRIGSFVSGMVSRMISGATSAVSGFINQIAQLPGKVYNELSKTLSRVMEWGSQIVSRLGEIAQRAWQAFVSGLGIGSPGYIQILTLKELDDTGKQVPRVASRIVDNLSTMSSRAVSAWGNPEFEYGFANAEIVKGVSGSINNQGTPTSTNNYTFNLYGDIDNEERMERIVNEVRRVMDWNNNTAGRTN